MNNNKLIEVADLFDSLHQTPKYSDSGYPMVRVADVSAGNLQLETCLTVSPSDYHKYTAKHIPTYGDIVISRVGTYGVFAYVNTKRKFCLGQNTAIISPRINSKYLYYCLNSPGIKKQIDVAVVGSTQKTISLKNIKSLIIPRFGELIEARIADYLSLLDDKIENNKRINENLYQLLMLSFKHDYWDIAPMQKDWRTVTLGETTSRFGTGLNPRKNFVLGHGNNYYVTIKNMGNNRIYLDDRCDKVDDEALVKIQKRSDLQVGDLLFSGIGTIGRVYLIDKPANNWNTSESIFNLRPNNEVTSEFLYLLLLNSDMQDYAISLSSGSVQKGIRMADLKRYTYTLPPFNQMLMLTDMWRPLIQQMKLNEYENDQLVLLRNALLPQLMSGEIDFSDLDF